MIGGSARVVRAPDFENAEREALLELLLRLSRSHGLGDDVHRDSSP